MMIAGNNGLQLQWSAPPSCPSQEDVRAKIARYLQPHQLADVGPASTQANVVVREQAGVWKAAINTRSAEVRGQRTLKGASCSEVASAAALILAMLVDPEAVRGATVEESDAPPPANGADKPESPNDEGKDVEAIIDSPKANSKAAAPYWQVGASAFLGWALLPTMATGIGMRTTWTSNDWAIRLLGRAWRESSQTLPLDGEAGGRFSAYALGARLWRRVMAWPRATLRGGGGVDGSLIRGAGYGISDPAEASAYGLDLACAGELAYQLGAHLELSFGAEVLVPTYRPRFVLDGRGEVWRRDAAAAILNIGLDYRF